MDTTKFQDNSKSPKRWAQRPQPFLKRQAAALEGTSPQGENGANPNRGLRRTLIVGGIAVATAAVGYLAWWALATPKKDEGDNDQSFREVPYPPEPAVQVPSNPPANQSSGNVWPLKLHSRGERVEVIQRALNVAYKAGLKVDGEWEAKTEAAMKAHNLPTVIYQPEFDRLLAKMRNLGLQGPIADSAKTLAEGHMFLPAHY